jgi:hypothetical protein
MIFMLIAHFMWCFWIFTANISLTEIIDDYTLEVVGYKSEQIIREIMTKVQAKIG